MRPGILSRPSSSADRVKPPVSYAEWTALLDRFAQGEDTVLELIEHGTFEWGPGVAERFVGRLDQAYIARKKAWVEALNRQLETLGGNVHNLRSVLGNARRMLEPIVRLTRLCVLPEEVQNAFKDDLASFLSEVQESLEKEFAKVPEIRDLCKLMLTQARLDSPLPESDRSAPPTKTDPSPPPGSGTPGRKVIL